MNENTNQKGPDDLENYCFFKSTLDCKSRYPWRKSVKRSCLEVKIQDCLKMNTLQYQCGDNLWNNNSIKS